MGIGEKSVKERTNKTKMRHAIEGDRTRVSHPAWSLTFASKDPDYIVHVSTLRSFDEPRFQRERFF